MASRIWLVVFFLITFVSALDYYKILDVDRSADTRDIRAAYKRLSKKFHPDKNKAPDAEERFVQIARAYEVLSDDEKRRAFDQFGEDGLKAHEEGRHHHPHRNPFDIFSSFFGGHPERQARRGPSSLTEFEVSLADMYKGTSVDFMIKKRILCDHCRGSGAASDGDIHNCSGCNGAGVKLIKQQIFPGMFAQSTVTCDECGGAGKVIRRRCPHCQGQKVMDYTGHYTLDITPGMPEGHEVIFEGEADENPEWEAGDIILRVRSKKDKGGFRRKETSLYWKQSISIDEALLGFERNVTHLDGRNLRLTRKTVTQPGFVQVLKGEGMPSFGNRDVRGDLYVEYTVVLPIDVSSDLRQKIRDVFQVPPTNTRDEL